MFDNKSSV